MTLLCLDKVGQSAVPWPDSPQFRPGPDSKHSFPVVGITIIQVEPLVTISIIFLVTLDDTAKIWESLSVIIKFQHLKGRFLAGLTKGQYLPSISQLSKIFVWFLLSKHIKYLVIHKVTINMHFKLSLKVYNNLVAFIRLGLYVPSPLGLALK